MTSEVPTLEQWIPSQTDPQETITLASLESEVRLQTTSRLAELPTSLLEERDITLSDLWDYYQLEIYRGRMRRDKIAAKECNQRCKHISFVYPASIICRHPTKVWFAQMLMTLGYRYCKGCGILIPKSIILELEEIRESRKPPEKRKIRTDATPYKCPCCSMKTALVSVLIRRTKMGREVVFKDEGY